MKTPAYLIGAVAGAAALFVGATRASVPDSAGVVHACLKSQSGQVRVTDSEDGVPPGCNDAETGLTWNVAGPPGQAGAPGTKGLPGDAGLPGPSGRIVTDVESRLTSFYVSDTKSLEIDCPAGTAVIGGGGDGGVSPQGGADITQSAPLPTGEGWYVEARRDDALGPQVLWELVGYAMCAYVGP